jgi:NAD(P)H-flavin reductase
MKYVRERRERQGKSSIGLLGPFGKAFLGDDWRSPLYVQELIRTVVFSLSPPMLGED